MPGIGKVSGSAAGPGLIIGPGAPTVLAENLVVSVIGDNCITHGEAPHILPTVVTASTSVFAMNKPVTVEAISTASCGHPIVQGAPTVIVGR